MAVAHYAALTLLCLWQLPMPCASQGEAHGGEDESFSIPGDTVENGFYNGYNNMQPQGGGKGQEEQEQLAEEVSSQVRDITNSNLNPEAEIARMDHLQQMAEGQMTHMQQMQAAHAFNQAAAAKRGRRSHRSAAPDRDAPPEGGPEPQQFDDNANAQRALETVEKVAAQQIDKVTQEEMEMEEKAYTEISSLRQLRKEKERTAAVRVQLEDIKKQNTTWAKERAAWEKEKAQMKAQLDEAYKLINLQEQLQAVHAERKKLEVDIKEEKQLQQNITRVVAKQAKVVPALKELVAPHHPTPPPFDQNTSLAAIRKVAEEVEQQRLTLAQMSNKSNVHSVAERLLALGAVQHF